MTWGLVGVLAFSFTMPFTRVADGALAPLFISAGRAVVAGVLAIVALAVTRSRRPRGREWPRLAIVGGGVVLGFPLLTSYALTRVPASHGAVVVALLPAATATMIVLRTRERPPAIFWAAAVIGAAAAVGFELVQGGVGGLGTDDLLLIAAVLVCAIGYAEGGLLSRSLGSWQTVSWALVVSLPLMAGLMVGSIAHRTPSAAPAQWAAFAYLCMISMYLGFFAWYRGLAIGPMAQVSQVQLLQPVMTICWAALILGERIGATTIAGAAVVIVSAAAAVRARLGPAPPAPSATGPWRDARSSAEPSPQASRQGA